MKSIILTLFVICVFGTWTHAQCGKRILWTSGKQAFTNANGDVQKEEQDKITLEIDTATLVFNHNNDPNDVMKGKIKETVCNWTDPYKNGKTVVKAELTEGHGDTHEAIVTIEGKDGKVTITLEFNDKPDMQIKAYVDKYEEMI